MFWWWISLIGALSYAGMLCSLLMLQAVVLVVFFVVIPLGACGVASKGDYPGREAIQRALAEKKK